MFFFSELLSGVTRATRDLHRVQCGFRGVWKAVASRAAVPSKSVEGYVRASLQYVIRAPHHSMPTAQ